MLLTIYNLPPSMRYTDVKALLEEKCGLRELILDGLVADGVYKKVKVGLADEEDAALLVRKINGLYVNGVQLYVEDVRKKKPSDQPYRSTSLTVTEMPGYDPYTSQPSYTDSSHQYEQTATSAPLNQLMALPIAMPNLSAPMYGASSTNFFVEPHALFPPQVEASVQQGPNFNFAQQRARGPNQKITTTGRGNEKSAPQVWAADCGPQIDQKSYDYGYTSSDFGSVSVDFRQKDMSMSYQSADSRRNENYQQGSEFYHRDDNRQDISKYGNWSENNNHQDSNNHAWQNTNNYQKHKTSTSRLEKGGYKTSYNDEPKTSSYRRPKETKQTSKPSWGNTNDSIRRDQSFNNDRSYPHDRSPLRNRSLPRDRSTTRDLRSLPRDRSFSPNRGFSGSQPARRSTLTSYDNSNYVANPRSFDNDNIEQSSSGKVENNYGSKSKYSKTPNTSLNWNTPKSDASFGLHQSGSLKFIKPLLEDFKPFRGQDPSHNVFPPSDHNKIPPVQVTKKFAGKPLNRGTLKASDRQGFSNTKTFKAFAPHCAPKKETPIVTPKNLAENYEKSRTQLLRKPVPVSAAQLLRKDNMWRWQVSSHIAKTLMNDYYAKHGGSVDKDQLKFLLKKCISARINVILGDQFAVPCKVICQRYYKQFPGRSHRDLFKTFVEKLQNPDGSIDCESAQETKTNVTQGETDCKLNPYHQKLLDEELQAVTEAYLSVCDDPDTYNDEDTCIHIASAVTVFTQNLSIHATRRLLNVNTGLVIRIVGQPELPKQTAVEAFLKDRQVAALSRSSSRKSYSFFCLTYETFDEICALKKAVIDGVEVNFYSVFPALFNKPSKKKQVNKEAEIFIDQLTSIAETFTGDNETPMDADEEGWFDDDDVENIAEHGLNEGTSDPNVPSVAIPSDHSKEDKVVTFADFNDEDLEDY